MPSYSFSFMLRLRVSARCATPPAQSARPEVRAHRLAEGESIVIDGAPDEGGRGRRPFPATDFLQRDPDNGAPATEKTEVRVAVRSRSHHPRRHLFRLRADAAARQPDAARSVVRSRRSLHVRDRSVLRRPHRLLLRDQPVGRDGRRPDHRSRPAAATSAAR